MPMLPVQRGVTSEILNSLKLERMSSCQAFFIDRSSIVERLR